MTAYEALAIIASAIAAIIALFAIWSQRRLQMESNELQKATAELARKQLEVLVREDREKSQARLSLDLRRDGKSFRFVITNIGHVDAHDADMKILVDKPGDDPIIQSERKSKLPARKLSPGSSVTLIAALHLGSPTAFNAELSWTNPDGTKMVDQTYAAV